MSVRGSGCVRGSRTTWPTHNYICFSSRVVRCGPRPGHLGPTDDRIAAFHYWYEEYVQHAHFSRERLRLQYYTTLLLPPNATKASYDLNQMQDGNKRSRLVRQKPRCQASFVLVPLKTTLGPARAGSTIERGEVKLFKGACMQQPRRNRKEELSRTTET